MKKLIIYCLLAFFATCLIGGAALFGFIKWRNPDISYTQIFRDIVGNENDNNGEKNKNDANNSDAANDNDIENQIYADESDNDSSEEELYTSESDNETSANSLTEQNEVIEDENLPEIVTDEKGEVTLVFGGDICFYDPFANMGAYRQRGSNIENCISPYLLGQMRDADICMVNNEFSYSDRGTPLEGKMYTFRSKPENVSILHDMGVDIVSIANNHAYDYGPDAFVDTLKTLDDAGVKRVGGGENLDEALNPVFITKNNLTIGYVSATQIERTDSPDTKGATENSPGVLRCYNQKELDRFLQLVKDTKEKCDFLVVYIHWGTENTSTPDWAQPHQAELISQAGADIIVGCHPHCLQGLTVMNNIPVIYSLGNYWFNSKTVDTALLKLKISGNGIESLQMIAAQQAGCSTKELEGGEKSRVINFLQSLSPEMKFDDEGFVTW